MTLRRTILRIALPLTCAALCARAPGSGAAVPDPVNSVIDLVLVGNTTGTPMGGAPPGYDVTVKDFTNLPIAGAVVTLDFSTSGMKLYSSQDAGTTINCALRTVSRNADVFGHANFAVRVGGYTNANLVQVKASGILLGNVRARSTDLDGADARTALGDLAHLSANFLSNSPSPETDFDLNGTTGLNDLGLFTSELLSLASGTYCP